MKHFILIDIELFYNRDNKVQKIISQLKFNASVPLESMLHHGAVDPRHHGIDPAAVCHQVGRCVEVLPRLCSDLDQGLNFIFLKTIQTFLIHPLYSAAT